jgi:hypothetical protein
MKYSVISGQLICYALRFTNYTDYRSLPTDLHSYLNASTEFASAALTACVPTVSNADTPASANPINSLQSESQNPATIGSSQTR